MRMAIVFLAFAESFDPQRSFNWRGGGCGINACQANLYRSHIVCSESTVALGIVVFERCFSWHMFSWLGGSVSHFHHILMSCEIPGFKTACKVPRSPQRLNYTEQSYFFMQLQGSLQSFISVFFFSKPPNASSSDDSVNHGGSLKVISAASVTSKIATVFMCGDFSRRKILTNCFLLIKKIYIIFYCT